MAEERTRGPGSSPVLFDLLDAMDGAAADADLLFLLTTNRADLLEPALAARPGRRRRCRRDRPPGRRRAPAATGALQPLLELHLSEPETDEVVATYRGCHRLIPQGVAATLAVLESLQEHRRGLPPLITAAHVGRALEDLLDSSQKVTRSLLGVGDDRENLPPGGGIGALPPDRHGHDQRSGNSTPLRTRRLTVRPARPRRRQSLSPRSTRAIRCIATVVERSRTAARSPGRLSGACQGRSAPPRPGRHKRRRGTRTRPASPACRHRAGDAR